MLFLGDTYYSYRGTHSHKHRAAKATSSGKVFTHISAFNSFQTSTLNSLKEKQKQEESSIATPSLCQDVKAFRYICVFSLYEKSLYSHFDCMCLGHVWVYCQSFTQLPVTTLVVPFYISVLYLLICFFWLQNLANPLLYLSPLHPKWVIYTHANLSLSFNFAPQFHCCPFFPGTTMDVLLNKGKSPTKKLQKAINLRLCHFHTIGLLHQSHQLNYVQYIFVLCYMTAFTFSF